MVVRYASQAHVIAMQLKLHGEVGVVRSGWAQGFKPLYTQNQFRSTYSKR